MILWLLTPVHAENEADDPWTGGPSPLDKKWRMVVRAATERRARQIAHSNAGDENSSIPGVNSPWLDSTWSSCVPLLADGLEEAVVCASSDVPM